MHRRERNRLKMNKFELLAPAGSFDSLRAAVNAGADAVYIGGKKFGARAFADNPAEDELLKCIDFCHLRGRRIYLTVNTLFKESELEKELGPFLRPYYEHGLDAVIVQDPGAMSYIEKNFPGLDIHISTQAAVTMAEGANRFKDMFKSITRVVPARELSLDELKRFRKDWKYEIEVFVHGALCYSCSGQCLLSSMIGGRSGNRGRCAQPCRKKYDDKYLLSPKDQCVLANLHKLMEIGIESFKIEGRMKSPEYTAGVVSVYRKYIDKFEELGAEQYEKWLISNKKQLDKDIDLLKELYNRGGFNDGYLFNYNGPDMMALERPNHSGLEVGEVINVRGREAIIKFSAMVNPQDVLEIRSNNKKIFEYTLGSGFDAGEVTGCITMKDSKAQKGMKVFRTRCNELLNSIKSHYIDDDTKIPVNIIFEAHKYSPIKLTVDSDNLAATVEGNPAEPAKNAPSDAAMVIKQLKKLGNTDFELKNIFVDIDDDLFLSSGELNNLRREACTLLYEKIVKRYKRSEITQQTVGVQVPEKENLIDKALSTAEQDKSVKIASLDKPVSIYSVWNINQIDSVAEALKASPQNLNELYYNISDFSEDEVKAVIKKYNENGEIFCGLWLGLPYVSRSKVYDGLNNYLQTLSDYIIRNNDTPGSEKVICGFIVRTQEELALLKSFDYGIRCDYNLYHMNSEAVLSYDYENTLPLELNFEELKEFDNTNSEIIAYGYLPVMFSAQCVYKNKFNMCKGSGSDYVTVTDELKHDFRCRQHCAFCTNIIYNSSKLNLLDSMEDLLRLNPRAVRYEFTFENPEEIKEVILTGRCSDSGHYTNGHFRRGIQ